MVKVVNPPENLPPPYAVSVAGSPAHAGPASVGSSEQSQTRTPATPATLTMGTSSRFLLYFHGLLASTYGRRTVRQRGGPGRTLCAQGAV